MSNWLIELSSRPPTDEEILRSTFEDMSVSELTKLASDIDPSSVLTNAEKLHEKLAAAEKSGRELAHENSALQKIAFVPALLAGAARLAPMAGRAVGALGGAKGIIGGVAKDMAIGTAASKAIGALKPAAPAASAAGEIAGGFKYAFAGGLLQRAAGYVARNPGTAATAAGALGGALLAPRDAQTGQKQYLRGAVMGGVGVAGVNALSNGALANKMRSSVMNRQNPLLGQGTRQYLMDSAAAGKGKSPISSSLRSKQTQYSTTPAPTAVPVAAPSTPIAPSSTPYTGGPTMGTAKLAGQRFIQMTPAEQILFVALEKRANQALVYEPATRTFVRPKHPMSTNSSGNIEPSVAGPESAPGK